MNVSNNVYKSKEDFKSSHKGWVISEEEVIDSSDSSKGRLGGKIFKATRKHGKVWSFFHIIPALFFSVVSLFNKSHYKRQQRLWKEVREGKEVTNIFIGTITDTGKASSTTPAKEVLIGSYLINKKTVNLISGQICTQTKVPVTVIVNAANAGLQARPLF